VAHSGAEPASVQAAGSPKDRRNPRKKTNGSALLERRQAALESLQLANAEVEAASAEHAPFGAAFEAIDRQVKEWAQLRHGGHVFSYDKWMSALDRRMAAGHAANPSKKRLAEAVRWRAAVMKELKEINQEIGE